MAKRRSRDLVPKEVNAIAVCFLNEDSASPAGILVRRFKRIHPMARVGAVLWSDGGHDRQLPVLQEADFVASTLTEAAREALSDIPPSPVASLRKIHIRARRLRTRVAAASTEPEM